MLEYRPAGPDDIGALVDLRIDFMRIVKDSGLPDEAAWRAELASLFARDMGAGALRCWLCLDGAGAAGARAIGASGLRVAGAEGEILNMYTAPGYRRRGIGSALLGLALGEARALGLSRLRLQSTDDGRRLYERAGFRDEGRDMVLELAPDGRPSVVIPR